MEFLKHESNLLFYSMPQWKSDIYCPKCNSGNVSKTEKCLIEYNYEVGDGIIEFDGPIEHSVESLYLMCTCNACGHLWNPRKPLFVERID